MTRAPRPIRLISHAAIRRKVREIARRITREFRGEPVHAVGVLNGACLFLADLIREIGLEVTVDFMAVASYGRSRGSSGRVKIRKDLDTSIRGLNVILVEDILDSGRTVAHLRRVLSRRRPKTLRIAVLLDKRARRRIREARADYVGFEIPNRFVVGYGLDHAGRFRNRKDICVLPRGRGRRGEREGER